MNLRMVPFKYSSAKHDTENTCDSSCEGMLCTRIWGHYGRHEASVGIDEKGAVIVAVWDS